MDHAVVSELLALSLFLFACRPLLGRLDACVHLWLLGWSFFVVHSFTLVLAGGDVPSPFVHWLSTLSVEACGICLLLAASDARRRPVRPPFLVQLALPMLLESGVQLIPAVSSDHVMAAALPWVMGALLILPLLSLSLIRDPERRRTLLPVASSFALLGFVSPWVAAGHPERMTAALPALLFLSAAYLYLQQAVRLSGGVVTAAVGLVAWGLSFLLAPPLAGSIAALRPEHGWVTLPWFLVVGGVMLTLLDDYVQRTERLAMHDPLTDLPNRRLFEVRFSEAMEEARRRRTTIACLVIDVDNFKAINDSLGHAVGDALLRALAVRLSWHMSGRDVLARTGGDEFTAMLAGVTDEHHLRFMAQAMMSAASVPVSVAGNPVDVRISMGVALSPDHADDIEELRERADEAMYRAKRRGGDLLVFAGSSEAELDGEATRPRHAPVLQMASRRRSSAS